jgi:hypothetical protein
MVIMICENIIVLFSILSYFQILGIYRKPFLSQLFIDQYLAKFMTYSVTSVSIENWQFWCQLDFIHGFPFFYYLFCASNF